MPKGRRWNRLLLLVEGTIVVWASVTSLVFGFFILRLMFGASVVVSLLGAAGVALVNVLYLFSKADRETEDWGIVFDDENDGGLFDILDD